MHVKDGILTCLMEAMRWEMRLAKSLEMLYRNDEK